jgi:alpha-galactosidase
MLGSLSLAIALPLLPSANALVRKDGVVCPFSPIIFRMFTNSKQGKLPALGWNSWNAFGCDINSTKILTAANKIVNLGLKDRGYEYVNSMTCILWLNYEFVLTASSR